MGVQKQVFASNAERGNFYKLSRQWGNKYRVYHNLPFLHIFDTKNLIDVSDGLLKPLTIDEIEVSRLKKTSVDFTLCGENDEPLVCIDFDGFQEGYNVGTKYHFESAANPWKEIIYNLKLKVAHGSYFPYFVLGSKEFADLSDDIRLTITDGIIGEVLSSRATRGKFAERFNPGEIGYTQEEFDELDPSDRQDIIQDWVIGVEVDNDFEFNPIHNKAAELSRELEIFDYSLEYIYSPEVNRATDLKERLKRLGSVRYQGAKVTIDSPIYGKIESSVTIPNFKTPHFSGLGLAEEIAHILTLQKLKTLKKKGNVK